MWAELKIKVAAAAAAAAAVLLTLTVGAGLLAADAIQAAYQDRLSPCGPETGTRRSALVPR